MHHFSLTLDHITAAHTIRYVILRNLQGHRSFRRVMKGMGVHHTGNTTQTHTHTTIVATHGKPRQRAAKEASHLLLVRSMPTDGNHH